MAKAQKHYEIAQKLGDPYAKLSSALSDLNKRITNIIHPIRAAKSAFSSFAEYTKAKLAGVSASLLNAIVHPFQTMKKVSASAIKRISSTVKKVGKTMSTVSSAIKNATSSIFSFGKGTKSANSGLMGFSHRIKSLALSALIFNQVSKLFNSMNSGMKQGFENLYNENENFKNSINGLKASLSTLGNSIAAAFAPIVQVAIPYIQQLIGWITKVMSLVGQFMGAITGQKTYTKAVKQSAGAMEDAAGAAGDAKKAMEGYLSPLDEINKMNKKDDSSGGGGGGAGGAGAMFEEAPIESSIVDLANRMKELLSKIFAPIKEAWNREGKFVMDSWKNALMEIWNLAKDIGRDLLIVWNQEATIQMLANILHIFGDIGLAVSNLAHNLDEAWNKNQIGLRILENIRDIFAIIIQHIRNAADYTVEWSKNLDFYPLLESINGLLEALEPLADNIGAGLEWFWKNVLLPIAGWTIQDAVPAFLNMLSAAIDVLNAVIDALKPLGTWLWENFLQPLGKWAGETIIAAMEKITDLLKKLGDWISNHQEAFQTMTVIIGSFFAAFKAVTAISGIVNFIASIGGLISIVKSMAGLITLVFNPWTLAIGAVVAAGILIYKNWDTIKKKAGELKKAISDAFNNLMESVKELPGKIKDKLGDAKQWLVEKGKNAIEGLKKGWDSAKESSFVQTVSKMGTFVKQKAGDASQWLQQKGKDAITGIKNGWESVKESGFLSTVAKIGSQAKTKIGDIGAIVKSKGQDIVTGLKNGYNSGINGFLTTVSGLKDKVRNGLSGLGEIGRNAASSLANAIKSVHIPMPHFSFTTKSFKVGKTSFSLPSVSVNWYKKGGLFNAPSVIGVGEAGSEAVLPLKNKKVMGMLADSIVARMGRAGYIPNVPIPRLAQGTVVPPNKEFISILGDNKREPEVVSPISTIEKAVENVMSRMGNQGGNQTIVIKQYLDGKQVAESVVKEGKVRQMATGSNMFMLGTT